MPLCVCVFCLFTLQPSACEEGCAANQTPYLLGVVPQDYGHPHTCDWLPPSDPWNLPHCLSFGSVGVLDPSPLCVGRSVCHPRDHQVDPLLPQEEEEGKRSDYAESGDAAQVLRETKNSHT